jgi:hypothetical protein
MRGQEMLEGRVGKDKLMLLVAGYMRSGRTKDKGRAVVIVQKIQNPDVDEAMRPRHDGSINLLVALWCVRHIHAALQVDLNRQLPTASPSRWDSNDINNLARRDKSPVLCRGAV